MWISLITALNYSLQIRAYKKVAENGKREKTAAQIWANFARSHKEQRDQMAYSLPWQTENSGDTA